MNLRPRSSRLILTASLALFGSLHAQTTWEGDVSTNWATPGNWNNGVPGTSKAAIFDDSSTVANQPFTSTGQQLADAVTFNTGGWTIGTDGDGYVNLRGTSPNSLISNGAGINTIGKLRTFANANVTVGTGNTLDILDSSGNLSFLTKDGAGTLIIGGTASVTEIPDVTAGTLLINSSNNYSPNSLTRTISDGAILGGSGLLSTRGNRTIEFVDGATFAPGATGIGDSTAGVFTTDASDSQAIAQRFNLNFQTGSIFAIDIYADGSSDMALFTGVATNTSTAMTLASGVTLALSGTAANTTYRVAEFSGAGEYNSSFGTFETITLNGFELTEGVDYTISYVDHTKFDAGTGYIEVGIIIPEPSTYTLIAGSLALLSLVLRRRRD